MKIIINILLKLPFFKKIYNKCVLKRKMKSMKNKDPFIYK